MKEARIGVIRASARLLPAVVCFELDRAEAANNGCSSFAEGVKIRLLIPIGGIIRDSHAILPGGRRIA